MDSIEYNEHVIPIGLIIERLMTSRDSHLHLFNSPMMQLTRYHICSMIWLIESVDVKEEPKPEQNTRKRKRFQTFNIRIYCAHCRFEVDNFSHSEVMGDMMIQKRCKIITRCLHSFFAKHHQLLLPESGTLEYKNDFCKSFLEIKKIEELKEKQIYLHEFLHYDDNLKNSWKNTNFGVFEFIGDIFYHYQSIVNFTKWTSKCVDKKTLEKYENARCNPKRTSTASGVKAQIHISKVVGELTGTIERDAKEKVGKESFNTKDSTRYKRFQQATLLIEDNDFILQMDWLMCVDKSVDTKRKDKAMIKRLFKKAPNANSIKEDAKKYFIGGDNTESIVKIVDKKWIAKYCSQETKSSLVSNVNQQLLLNEDDKKEIRLSVKMYESSCVRYIHKFVHPKTNEIVFCRAELKVTKKRSAEFIILKEEIILHEFILDLVTLNSIQSFYTDLMDRNVINKTFPVPEVSAKVSQYQPSKENNFPPMKYPQYNSGLCGICSMCSAIEFRFGSQFASYVYEFRHKYHEHFIKTDNSKKSPIMNFLKTIIFDKRGDEYKLKKHSGKSIKVGNLMKDNIYDHVVVALLKDSRLAKDHIVTFCRGWIFDSNLTFAIPISNINLDWCCGNSDNDAMFIGFYELFSIYEK